MYRNIGAGIRRIAKCGIPPRQHRHYDPVRFLSSAPDNGQEKNSVVDDHVTPKSQALKDDLLSSNPDGASIRRLVQIVWPERRRLVLGTAMSAASASVTLAFPQAVGYLMDIAMTPEASAYGPMEVTYGLLGLTAFQAGVIVFRVRMTTRAGENISATTRTKAFSSMLDQEIGFYDVKDSGEMLQRLSNDASSIQRVVTSSLAQALRSTTLAAGAGAAMIYSSPKLALLSFGLFPAVFLYSAWKGRYMRRLQRDVTDDLSEATSVAQNALSNLRTLRSMGSERFLFEPYTTAITKGRERAIEVGMSQGYFDASVLIAGNLSFITVLGVGGDMVLHGAMTPGQLSSFLLYSIFLGFQTSALSGIYTDYQRALGAMERLLAIIDREPAMQKVPGELITSMDSLIAPNSTTGPSIDFEGVSFTYPARPEAGPILQDFTAHIEGGEAVGIMGSSGAGKSTVFRLLSRLYDPDPATTTSAPMIRIGGVDIRAIDLALLRGRVVGVVPQEPMLVSGSIGDNIALGHRHCSPREVLDAAEAAGLGPLLARLPEGLNTRVGELGVQLSGGEKQRVAIARLVLANPPIVLLDEFTSALDPHTEAAIVENLRPVLEGKTVLAIVHRRKLLDMLGIQRMIHIESSPRPITVDSQNQ